METSCKGHDMKTVMFAQVAIGTQFRETENGSWYLKTGKEKAVYHADGAKRECDFDLDEDVLVDE